MTEAERIAALQEHPILREVLADLPEETREKVIKCIVSAKQFYPLSSQEEDAVFELFSDTALAHLENIISQVSAAVNA